jgi:hypothetical protein
MKREHSSTPQFIEQNGTISRKGKGMNTDHSISNFKETPAREWSEESEKILQMRISELGLKLEGTRLEELVSQLYRELDSAGIMLKPRVYLSDEWGCPDCRDFRCLAYSGQQLGGVLQGMGVFSEASLCR